MVTDALIAFVFTSARIVVGLLPVWVPPADAFGATFTSVASMAAKGNGWFPVTVLGVCLGLVLALKVLLLGWRVVLFVYHQIWGSD